jgi:hypothetical protein
MSAWAVRGLLAGFVLAWILGPYELRDAVPIWAVFLVALGLELQFLWGAWRSDLRHVPDRSPQESDRERLGYGDDVDELVIVDDGEHEVWLAYGEGGEEEAAEVEEPLEPEVEPEPAPRPRGPLRGFAWGVAVIAALALAVWVIESRTGWDSVSGERRLAAVERFSEEGSRIAGKPVTIRCDESRDYVGFVQHADGIAIVGGDRAYLTPEICHDLYRLAFEDEVRGARTGRAVAVLAHEAWHLRGEGDEGRTECYALQSGVELGVRLGLSEDRARQLMRQQLAENAGRGASTAEYRVPAECVDGSPLDLRPSDADFP